METPLQAARHKRGWSQSRLIWELTHLAKRKGCSIATAASLKTLVSRWENGHATPDSFHQPLLCELYKATPNELGFGYQTLPEHLSASAQSADELLCKTKFTRDDLESLSQKFDDALARSSVDDVNHLAHEWLIAEPPQVIELAHGRRIGSSLVASVEHRVIQLRRADDFLSGRDSHVLIRKELQKTVRLLEEASYNDDEARRLLTAIGELAQLALWVAADAGLYAEAARYTVYGLLAAHAANNLPLAANIISTFSYQVANTGNPHHAAVLARTAYAGTRRDASATTKALLLERIAWADAKSGELRSCEYALGQVQDAFNQSKPEDDPDWVYWLNQEEIDVMAGRCYTELRKPKLAEPLLHNALDNYNHALVRENSLYLSWLAEDYIQLNEIDHAASVATEVLTLASRTNSARTSDRLHHLAKLLKRYGTARNVAEFLELYKDLAA
jgi:transcriptional regulator with XRE-family HTH domain